MQMINIKYVLTTNELVFSQLKLVLSMRIAPVTQNSGKDYEHGEGGRFIDVNRTFCVILPASKFASSIPYVTPCTSHVYS